MACSTGFRSFVILKVLRLGISVGCPSRVFQCSGQEGRGESSRNGPASGLENCQMLEGCAAAQAVPDADRVGGVGEWEVSHAESSFRWARLFLSATGS
jgi:hypothetical protein